MKPSEIQRALILFYRSNNAHDFVNFVKPDNAMGKLTMDGLKEYAEMLKAERKIVLAEIKRRWVYALAHDGKDGVESE